jgi:hypothetical protein
MPNCSAINCSKSPADGIRLFRFPRDPDRRKLWAVNTRRDGFIPSDNHCLCEVLHLGYIDILMLHNFFIITVLVITIILLFTLKTQF